MDAKVQAFVQKYTGQMIVFQNNAEVPTGSCMNVPHQFIFEVLNITDPHIIYGASAYMVYTNFASLPAAKYFTLVPNSPTNVPSAGDIPVFGQTTDTPEGHICLATGIGDVNTFQSFDMDYPYGSTAHLVTHNYNGLLGWLHYNDPGQPTTQNVTITDQQGADLLNAQINATSQCQAQLKTANDTITSLQTQQQKDQDLIQSLQDEKKSLSDQITALQTQLSGEQKEIINLNTQIETQASSNKDYAAEIYTLSHDNTSLSDSFNSVVDGLGITRTNKTLDQITKDTLSKEDELDTLLKSAGIVEGLLHNMAKTLQLNDVNLTDQQVANNIITYVKSLQGKLQSVLPANQQVNKPTNQQTGSGPGLLSKFVGWFWQSS